MNKSKTKTQNERGEKKILEGLLCSASSLIAGNRDVLHDALGAFKLKDPTLV